MLYYKCSKGKEQKTKRKEVLKMTMQEIKKAREFYGVYDYVSDKTIERLCEDLRNHGIQWVKENTGILTKLSYKNW